MPTLHGFHHVTLTVTDLERSTRWYEQVLGLKRIAYRQGPGWNRTLLRGDDGVTIGLTVHERTEPNSAFDESRIGLDHFSFHCADLAEVRAWEERLDSLGVAHGGIVATPSAHVLTCRDPDGIAVEFFAPFDPPSRGAAVPQRSPIV